MKDYFDLWVLARYSDLDGETLRQAIRATFQRRATPIPEGVPFGLTEGFAEDPQKQTQWRAFLRKNALEPVALADVLERLRGFLMPPLAAAARVGQLWSSRWSPGSGWS
jgi:hypothetical protein